MKKYSGVYFLFLSCVILAEIPSFTTVKASMQAPFSSLLVDRETKYLVPQDAVQNFQEQKFSIFYEDADSFTRLPQGSVLFLHDASLAGQYDELIALFVQDPDFIVWCRKIHFNVLFALYNHLMKLFVTVNMHHPGTVQDGQRVHVDVQDFLYTERAQAVTKKTLFISMLMEMLEIQFNSMVRTLLPDIQQYQATITGKTLIQADYGVDLSTLLTQDLQSESGAKIAQYKMWLQKYFAFFASYTNYITRVNDRTGKNEFVSLAQFVAKQTPGKHELFFAHPDALHFVQISFQKIKDIVHTQPFGWPDFIVQQAQKQMTGTTMSGVQYPLAYCTDAKKNRVYDVTQAARLFLVIPQKDRLFEQELLQEPKWMRSARGMQEIIQGCFGNVVALTRKGILDPWTEAIIQQIHNQRM